MHDAWESFLEWVVLPAINLAQNNLAWVQSLSDPWKSIVAGLELWIAVMAVITISLFTWRGFKGIRSFFFTLFTGLSTRDLLARIEALEKKGSSSADLSGVEARLTDLTSRVESIEEGDEEDDEDEDLPSAKDVNKAVEELLAYLDDPHHTPEEFRSEIGRAFGVLARFVIETKNQMIVDAVATHLVETLSDVDADELHKATSAQREAVLKSVGARVFNGQDPAFQARVEAKAKEIVLSWGKTLPTLDETAIQGLSSEFLFSQFKKTLANPSGALTDRVLSELFFPWLQKVLTGNDLVIGLETSSQVDAYMRERLSRIRDAVTNAKALTPGQERIVQFMDEEIIRRLNANGSSKGAGSLVNPAGIAGCTGIHPAGHTS